MFKLFCLVKLFIVCCAFNLNAIETNQICFDFITPVIKIDGVAIDSVCSEYNMTVGGWEYEQKSKSSINNFYKYLVAGQKTEVPAPTIVFVWMQILMDRMGTINFYQQTKQY